MLKPFAVPPMVLTFPQDSLLPNVVNYKMTANADKQNAIISILVLLTFLTGTKKCKTRMSVIPGGKL